MPAQGRGPRAGGGAQSPEPPSEVRSPRPRLVERAGGRASRRGRHGGGQIKNNPRAGKLARAPSPRSVPGDSRGGGVGEGRAGFPLLRGAGCPPARRGSTCAGPRARSPSPGLERPLPGTGAAGGGLRLQPRGVGGKRAIIYYLRALIGSSAGGGGLDAAGTTAFREGVERAGLRRVRLSGRTSARLLTRGDSAERREGSAAGLGFCFSASVLCALALPRAWGGGCGLCSQPCAPLAAAAASPLQPGPHLSSSLVKWSVQGTAASLG